MERRATPSVPGTRVIRIMPLAGATLMPRRLRRGWRRTSAVRTRACEVIADLPRAPRRPRHFADLRSLLLAPPDTELLHPTAQRARVHVEQARRAARAVHPPVRAPEDREDVIPLDQRERDGVGRGRGQRRDGAPGPPLGRLPGTGSRPAR